MSDLVGDNTTVAWLCGCGMGRLAVHEDEVPDYCPLCGYPIKAGQEEVDDE